MAVADKIQRYVQRLPDLLQAQVLDFVAALLAQAEEDDAQKNDTAWKTQSLAQALRGMEDEEGPEYDLSDLKESFS